MFINFNVSCLNNNSFRRADTPKQPRPESGPAEAAGSASDRPTDCVSTSEQSTSAWGGRPEPWGALAAEAYLKAASAAARQHAKPEENQPSSTDPHN